MYKGTHIHAQIYISRVLLCITNLNKLFDLNYANNDTNIYDCIFFIYSFNHFYR